jgi:hypothetical protein
VFGSVDSKPPFIMQAVQPHFNFNGKDDDDFNKSSKTLIYIVVAIILLWILSGLISCNPVKQYQKFETKCAAAIPNDTKLLKVAEPYNLKANPCDTVAKQGKADTVTQNHIDTVIKYSFSHDTVTITKYVTQYQNQIIHRTDTLVDNRKIKALHDELQLLADSIAAKDKTIAADNAIIQQDKNEKKTMLFWIIGLVAGLVLLIILFIKKIL